MIAFNYLQKVEQATCGRPCPCSRQLLPLLLWLVTILPLWAYQWPLPTEQIVRGFLAGKNSGTTVAHSPLPNLGVWFEIAAANILADISAENSKAVVQTYHSGEAVYFETSAELNSLGPMPRQLQQTILVQHDKLLFRYSSDKLQALLRDSYQFNNGDLLFSHRKAESEESLEERAKPLLYMEIFDTQSQTVLNPKLLMPNANGNASRSRPYLAEIPQVVDESAKKDFTVAKILPLNNLDLIARGVYNLSFRFPIDQGPPLRIDISIDDKKIYRELFDQVYSTNSRLMINDRDLRKTYILDEQGSRFLLGKINLQDRANNSVTISVDEENIDGRHNISNYKVRIR